LGVQNLGIRPHARHGRAAGSEQEIFLQIKSGGNCHADPLL
jgi:hypothetical protein